MPAIFQPSTSSTVILAADTAFYLAEDEAITASNAVGIISTADNLQLFIEGDVISLFTPLGGFNGSAIASGGDDVEIYIGHNASIIAAGDSGSGIPGSNALNLGGVSNTINYGTIISAESAVKYNSTADGSSFINHGNISSTNGGSSNRTINISSADDVEFVNHGTISGGAVYIGTSDNFVLVNHGSIISLGTTYAVDTFASDSLTVFNYGVMLGGASGVEGTTTVDTVENHGEMNGLSLGNGNDEVINTGLLSGVVFLGANDDAISNSGTVTGDVNLGTGADVYEAVGAGVSMGVIDGYDGNDTITGGTLADVIEGGNDNDLIRGRAGDDEIDGGTGNDTLRAGAGDDEVFGGTGDDVIRTGAGEDTVFGGAGLDIITGGTGADTFVFTSALDSPDNNSLRDIYQDFVSGEDVFDLSAFGVFNLNFIGDAGFSGTGAEIRATDANAIGRVKVFVDLNGDGIADMKFVLNNTTTLTEDDFLL